MSRSRSSTIGGSVSTGASSGRLRLIDRKSTRLNSSHRTISYAVFCLKKKKKKKIDLDSHETNKHKDSILKGTCANSLCPNCPKDLRRLALVVVFRCMCLVPFQVFVDH